MILEDEKAPKGRKKKRAKTWEAEILNFPAPAGKQTRIYRAARATWMRVASTEIGR